MRFAEDSPPAHSIHSYTDDGIIIDGRLITRSVVVSPDVIQDWQPTCVKELTAIQLEPLCALQPEIVIIGTGKQLEFPSPELAVYLQNKGIGVEIMTNSAACRTFNVLLSEDRRVVVALLQK